MKKPLAMRSLEAFFLMTAPIFTKHTDARKADAAQGCLEFQDDGHDHGAAAGCLLDEALQVRAHFLLDHTVVGLLLGAEPIQRLEHHFAGLVGNVCAAEAAHDYFRLLLHLAGALVDGKDREHDAVFRKNAAVANYEVFNHIDRRAGVDEDSARGYLVLLAGVVLVEFEHVAVFDNDGVLHRTGFHGHLRMFAKISIVAVYRDEELGAHQVDEQTHLFLASVAADVNEAVGAVVANDVRVAAVKMVDDTEDAFLIAGDDSGTEHHGIAGVDLCMLVVVYSGAAECAHGLALRAADEDHQLLRRVIAHLSRLYDEAGGNVDVAQVLSDLGALHHGAADDGYFAAMRPRQLHRDADAIDRRGEAGEEQLPFCSREDLVEARNDGPLAGRVAGALDVGRVLKERQDAALAVLGKGVQVECHLVERRQIDFEVAGVDDYADRCFNGQGHAIDQRVSDANGLDDEGTDSELFLGSDFDELDVVEQLVLFKLAFDISQRELGGIDGNLELVQNPGQAANVVLVAVGEDDGAHMLPVLNEVSDIGNNDIDAQQLRLREH